MLLMADMDLVPQKYFYTGTNKDKSKKLGCPVAAFKEGRGKSGQHRAPYFLTGSRP